MIPSYKKLYDPSRKNRKLSSHKRPSKREISNKLRDAKFALNEREGEFGVPFGKIAQELNTLGIGDSSEVWMRIKEILPEISHDDYCGGFPPVKSYEGNIYGTELWAFVWDSRKLNGRYYLKFTIVEETFQYVSFHKNRKWNTDLKVESVKNE